MRLSTFGLGVLLVLLFGACEKNELPENIIGTPSFFAEGTIDGAPLFFAAGPENVIIENSFEVADNDLPVFSAEFSNAGCSACSQSLFIEIIGSTELQGGLSIPDYIPEGSYSLAGYQSGQGEGLFQFELDNVVVMSTYIQTIDGNILYTGAEIPDLELPDGAYSLGCLYNDPSMNCIGTYNYDFIIENGALCGANPSIEIDGDGILTFTADSDSETFLLVINNNELLEITPGTQLDINQFLGPFDVLEFINILDVSPESCGSSAMWTFGGVEGNYCSVTSSITELDIEVERQPMTALIKYVDEDFNTYTSSVSNNYAFEILNLQQMGSGNSGSEAFRCDFVLDTYLVNTLNPNDSVRFVINNASIPVGME